MTAQQLLSVVSEVIYLGLFALATLRLIRARSAATIDTFLFFGVIATILLSSNVVSLLGLGATPPIIAWVGVTALPYLLLRLADDFRPQASAVMIVSAVLFVAVSVIGIIVPQPWPIAINLLPVAYTTVIGGYASLAFLSEARRSRGVTQRRMQAVALGSGLLALTILLLGVELVLPGAQTEITIATQAIGILITLSYFVGFAPPAFLRRGWQEPALRALLDESAELVELGDPYAIAARLEITAVAATGADGAGVGLYDDASGVLHFREADGTRSTVAVGEAISGRAFATQEAILSTNARRDAPEQAATYQARSIRAILSAPITSGERRLGVITVYAARPPVFSDDAIALITMLAEQAALVLRSHELLTEAAQVRAMAEMTRLKDDFLSVVAHDVRTPLTTILINAELLERALHRASPANAEGGREPSADARRATSLREEAIRLKQLVEDYLDVVRAEHGRELRRDQLSLAGAVQAVIEDLPAAAERVQVTEESPVVGTFDGSRVQQMIQNLLSNALKYSPSSQPVLVRIGAEDGGRTAVLTVTDTGIGIPEADQPRLFERFHRGSNTDDREYRGLGLGLYICHQVATEHGGSIEVNSRVGRGTTFTVRLPLEQPATEPGPRGASAQTDDAAPASAYAGPDLTFPAEEASGEPA